MSDNIWVEMYQEVEEDGGRRYGTGDMEPYETYTSDRRRLFDDLQREYGPCRGSIYRDLPNDKVQRIGWIFEKRVKWDRSGAATVRTWITLVTPDLHPIQVTKQVHLPISL